MIPESQLWEFNILRNLQSSFEARGFKFHINPSPDLVPRFLEGESLDAIAIAPNGGGIVIEVKKQRTTGTDRRLTDLAKKIAAEKGWELQIFYTNPATEVPDNIKKPTLEQIDARLAEVRDLAATGHLAPALILGWSVLESLARLAGGPGSSRGYSPIQAVQALAEEGYIENREAQELREMAKLRSAVVHGDFSVNVSAEELEFLLKQLETLKSYIQNVTSERSDGS